MLKLIFENGGWNCYGTAGGRIVGLEVMNLFWISMQITLQFC